MARRNSGSSFRRHMESRDRMGRNSVNRTLENFREMGEHVASAAKQALKNSAYQVVADAKSHCPVGRTGNLRNSIHAEVNRNGSSYKIIADAERNGFHYAKVVEFSPKINKPFMYPAIEENRARFNENIRNAVSQAIARGHA